MEPIEPIELQDETITLRIGERARQMLREVAAAEDRSMSATVRYLVAREHERLGLGKGKPMGKPTPAMPKAH
jgi:hypothetical protein